MGAFLPRVALACWLLSLASLPAPGVERAAPADDAGADARRVDALLTEELFRNPANGSVDLAPATDDETFLRRATLDLIGRLPSPAEVTAFSLNPASDKRRACVERLLAHAGFGRNWGRYWRDVIFYRRNDDRALLARAAAEKFLTEKFNANAHWDEIAQSLVSATGDIREQGATSLVAAQMGDVNDVTAEVSRIFLGVQIQCAQCHDHPTDRWKRQQFHELAAFFPRIGLRPLRDGMKRSFEVVSFDRQRGMKQPMGMLRRGELEHYMPDLKDPTAQGTLMQPVFFLTGQKLPAGQSDHDRRASLAGWMTARSNPWFARAFVNRIWAELVGEGFYEPVDDMGPDRACSAPKTMDYLASRFAERGYDVTWLFRAILSTDAYQRVSRPRRNPDQVPFTANCSQRLRSDQLFDALIGALEIRPGQNSANQRLAALGPPRMAGPRAQFAAVFGYDPSDRREEITGTIPQALLMMNSPIINRALDAHRRQSALGKLVAGVKDDEEVAVELYLRTLAREPNDKELAVCREYAQSVPDRAAAYEDIFWALLNSAEFLHRP